ncbi:ABC transporter substrate-binding protein [Paenibacillus solanacearum]|nr:ABC transporter substrate-binding protein [Paenibacillus solanacearum]
MNVETAIAELSKHPIELSLYENASSYTQKMFDDLYGDLLKKKFPNVSIKLFSPNKDSGGQGLNQLILSGVKLDLIKVSGASFYTFLEDNGLQDDVSDLIVKYNYDLNKFHPSVLSYMRSFGTGKEIYGIPNAVAATAMFYNKDIFDRFGVPYPKDGMTWDETYELARKVTHLDGGVQYLGFQENISFLTITNQLSQSFLDPKTNKPTINQDNWKTFINNFARFHQIDGNQLLPSYNNAMWKEGRVAMAVGSSGGSWNFTYDAPFKWDMVELPYFKDAPRKGSGLQVPFHAISKTSEKRDLAFLISAYIASEPFQKEVAKLGYVPPIKIDNLSSLLGTSVPQLAGKNIKAAVPLETAAPPFPTNGYQSLIAGYVNTAYSEVATGKKDVNTALRDAEELADKKLKEAAFAGK